LVEYTRLQWVQNFFGYEVIGRREKYEDTNNDSDIGVTAHGARSASGATTDAGADEGTADDCAGEREEKASHAGADQTAGKT